jgi:hypothetical protein
MVDKTMNKTKQIRNEPCYEIYIFMMLCITLLFTIPDIENLNGYTASYYVLPYSEFGFKSRLLIGSSIRLFTDYVSSRTLYVVITIISLVFIALVSLVIGSIMKKVARNSVIGAEILVVLFVACPVSIQYLFNINNFGRYDLFSILITILLLLCMKNEKTKWFAPFICFFAMLLNYNYVFMYMPVVGIVMVYEYLTGGRSKTRLLIFVVSCAAVAASFIYFKVLAPVSAFSSPEEVKQYLAGITDVQGGEIPIFYDFCYSLTKIYTRGFENSYSWFLDLLKVYGSFILFSTGPAYAFFIVFWRKAGKNANRKTKKFIYSLCVLAPMGGFPMFLAIDWDRWFPTIFISQLMLVLYFIAVNDTGAVDTLQQIKQYFERHLLFALVSIVYLSSSIFSNDYSVYL